MMSARVSRVLAAAAVGISSLAASRSAHADEQSSPGYEAQPATTQYTAPLQQQTQPSYVPQSVALSGPSEIKDYPEDAPVPAGYRPVQRVRRGMIIGGAVTFGSLYFISALVAAAGADSSSGSNPTAPMWIPAVGPFVQMFTTESATANVFLAIDGIGQTAGLAMFIYGISSPKTVLVRNDLASPSKPTIRALPMTGQGTTGMALVGTF